MLTIADEDNPTVLLVGWTTLGTIAEYGYPRQYDSTGFRQTDLLDLKELFRGPRP